MMPKVLNWSACIVSSHDELTRAKLETVLSVVVGDEEKFTAKRRTLWMEGM